MKFDRSYMIVAALLVLSGAVSWTLYFKKYAQSDTVNIHTFPNEFKGWSAEEIPITDHEYDILETRNAFTRRYTNGAGQEIVLFIVYSQNNRKVSHPPEVCYSGSGAVFANHKAVYLKTDEPRAPVIRANKILVEFQKAQQLMYYWFKVGGTFTSNYWKQQTLIALKTLLGQPSSSALIRITADVEDEDFDQAQNAVKAFTKDAAPLFFRYLP